MLLCRTLHPESSFAAVTNRQAVFTTPIPNIARRCAGIVAWILMPKELGSPSHMHKRSTRLPDYYFLESWMSPAGLVGRMPVEIEIGKFLGSR